LTATREKARRCCGKYRLEIQSELGKQSPEVEGPKEIGSAAGVAKGSEAASVDDADKEADLCAVKFKGRKRKVPGLRPR
jgi:hypothetical protein